MSTSDKSQLSSDDNARQLKPMTPKYNENQHRRYVNRLRNALYEQNCKSVALSGSYGSGKSSILEQFVKEAKEDGHSVAKVSLATFNADLYRPGDNGKSSLTALLEREILGQLLYQGDPAKAPKSSFNQIHNASLRSKVKSAVPVSLIIFITLIGALIFHFSRSVTFASYLTFMANTSKERLQMLMTLVIFLLAVAFLAISLICGYVLWVFDKARIKSISASGITLSIAADEDFASYFNKYRDELIYLFEVNSFDTVIFEDIDRFDDLAIFEELRKLNDLLNMAPGIVGKEGNKVVSFVYAVKDSIFALDRESDQDSREVLDSGRVKFFDMIISVVPFISKFNANEMVAKVFESELEQAKSTKEGQRFSDLLLLAAPYIADMPLMISIRNDYLVMVQEMGSPSFDKPSSLGLTCTGILAIAIYKNLYPLEYEDLRIHKGKLNELYDIHQRGINRAVMQLSAEIKLREQCEVNDCISDGVAETLGNHLIQALTERVDSINQLTIESYEFDISTNENDSVCTTKFWNCFLELNPDDILYIGRNRSYGYPHIKLTKSEFLSLLDVGLPDIGIQDFMQNGLKESCSAINSRIESIRIFDFYTNPNLLCPTYTVNQKDHLEPFTSIVKNSIGEGLVYELIMNGFIRKDFDLYISKYPSDAKPRVVNFVYHCYQRGVQDLDYAMDNDDCQAVLNIIPTTHLGKSCCFNRYLFAYVLSGRAVEPSASAQDAINSMVDGVIGSFSSSGKQLIECLLEDLPNNRSQVQTFISTLLAQTERAFDILVDSSKDICSLQTQHELMSYALANMNTDCSYTYELSSPWLQKNIESMSIARIVAGETRAIAIASYLKQCSVTIHELSSLGDQLGMSVIDLGNYDVTRANLLFACNTSRVPSLDTLDEVHPVVYEKVISSEEALASYLNAMGPTEYSATQFAPFVFNGLCRGVESWQQSADVDSLANTIVARLDPTAETVDLDMLHSINSVDELNVMGRALLRELILNQKVVKTYRNAVYILKLENVYSAFRDLNLFDRFMGLGDISEMPNDLSNRNSDVTEFANGLLYRAHLSSDELLNAMCKLKEFKDDSFPIVVDSDTISEINYENPTIIELTEHELIGPLNVVYEYLDRGNWNFRRRILKKLLSKNSVKDRSVLPRLYACDLPRIAAAAKTWGSWLAEDIASDPDYYVDQYCEDDSEKEKVLTEIKKKP